MMRASRYCEQGGSIHHNARCGNAIVNLRSGAQATPVLRLVGGRIPVDSARAEKVDRSTAMREIVRENRVASLRTDLDPNDPRWVLAARTRNELQGAALTADRRAKLLGVAYQLGMRPFDANLVIAIVQDEARMASAGADATWELAERLRIIPARAGHVHGIDSVELRSDGRGARGIPLAFLLVVSTLLGLAGLVVLLRWLMS